MSAIEKDVVVDLHRSDPRPPRFCCHLGYARESVVNRPSFVRTNVKSAMDRDADREHVHTLPSVILSGASLSLVVVFTLRSEPNCFKRLMRILDREIGGALRRQRETGLFV